MTFSEWSRGVTLAGLGMLLAVVLLLAGVARRPVAPQAGPEAGAAMRMRGVSLAGPGRGKPWRVHVEDLAVQRRKLMVFGVAGNYEMVLRGVEVDLRCRTGLSEVLAQAGPILWKRWPGIPVRFEGFTLRVRSAAPQPWVLSCRAVQLQKGKKMLLHEVDVLEPDGRAWGLPLAYWDLRSGALQPAARAR